MKNVILTHNELQLNLFYAVSYGLQCQQPDKNLHIIPEVLERDFQWKVVRYKTKESSAIAGEPIFYYQINKGDYQMNDIRIGVTISYLRDEAEKFLKQFNEYQMKQQPIPELETEQIYYEIFHQVEPNAKEKFCVGLNVVGLPEEVPLSAYGITLHSAIEKFEEEFSKSDFVITLSEGK